MGLITCRKEVYDSDSTSVGAVSVEGLCTTQGVTPRDGRLTHAEDVAHKLQVKAKSLSPVQLSATLRTAAHQAPPSMGFSRQEYYSGLPFSSPRDLPPPRELKSAELWADSLPSAPQGNPINSTTTTKKTELQPVTQQSIYCH